MLESYKYYGTKEKAEQSKGIQNLEWQGCRLLSSCSIEKGRQGKPH